MLFVRPNEWSLVAKIAVMMLATTAVSLMLGWVLWEVGLIGSLADSMFLAISIGVGTALSVAGAAWQGSRQRAR